MRAESVFLRRFDRVYKAVNDAVDMNNNDLVLLVRASLQNNGKLSNHRLKQLVAKGHPAALLAEAQQAVYATLAELDNAS